MQITRLECPSHEALYRVTDAPTGLAGFIAIHSTARGPATGGLRFRTYDNEDDAIADVLNLSRGMTYKNAAADLPLGGGKAVIIGDPETDKSPRKLRAFGDAIQSLRGRYWTAEDMGLTPGDMETLAATTRYVAGRTAGPHASGDPSPATAKGVLQGMRIALRHATGNDRLRGRRVAVQGLGHVGWALAGMLYEAGAGLIVADIDADRVARAQSELNAVAVDPGVIHEAKADVFAPCAIGGTLNARTIPELGARIVAGSANNQLAGREDANRLMRHGILFAPDYVINCGGVINVAAEILRIRDREQWLEDKLGAMGDFLSDVLSRATRTGLPPANVADRIVEETLLPHAA